MKKNAINLSYCVCVCVCTDSAKSVTGKFSGLVARVEMIKEKTEWTNSCIYRQALACNLILARLATTLSDSIKSNLFRIACYKLPSIYALYEDF